MTEQSCYLTREQRDQRLAGQLDAEQRIRESDQQPTRPAAAPRLGSTAPAQMDLAGGSNPLTGPAEQLPLLAPTVGRSVPPRTTTEARRYHSPAWGGAVEQTSMSPPERTWADVADDAAASRAAGVEPIGNRPPMLTDEEYELAWGPDGQGPLDWSSWSEGRRRAILRLVRDGVDLAEAIDGTEV